MTLAELIVTILTVAFFVGALPLLAYMRWQTHRDREMAARFRNGTWTKADLNRWLDRS